MSSDVYIKRLSALHVGPFRSLEVKFSPGINVIIGPNSCGKSTILKTIGMCFGSDHKDYRLKSESRMATYIRFNHTNFVVGLDQNSFDGNSPYRKTQLRSWNTPKNIEFDKKGIVSLCSGRFHSHQEFEFSPHGIGPNRFFEYVQINGMVREKTRSESIAEYRSQLVNRLRNGKLPSPKQWMINRYFQVDKDWAYELRYNFELIMNQLHLLAPNSANFKFLRIEKDLEPQFKLNGENIYLEELSSGFQSILSIVFSIVDWIESTNIEGRQKIDSATGTVLIDEIDAHLHPEWQQTILESLRKIFPYIQFIITTHSPHIAATCKMNELIIIPKHNGIVDISPSSKSYSGWALDNLLTSLMGLEDTRLDEFNHLYKQIEIAIDSVDEKRFLDLLDQLELIVSPDDPTPQVFRLQFAKQKMKASK